MFRPLSRCPRYLTGCWHSVLTLALSMTVSLYHERNGISEIVSYLNFTLQLTLWLQDLGISYKTDQRGEENWLDSILWLCAVDDVKVADSEVFMKECVVLNLFNQLRTGLTTAESFPLSIPEECTYVRNELTKCIATDHRHAREVVTNGHVVRKLLRHLQESKSIV